MTHVKIISIIVDISLLLLLLHRYHCDAVNDLSTPRKNVFAVYDEAYDSLVTIMMIQNEFRVFYLCN